MSDLDRPLWLPEGKLGRSAERAIATAHEAGLAFLVASGRNRAYLERFARRYGPIDGVVAENGGVLLLPAPGGARVERLVDSADLRAARERLAGAGLQEFDLGDVIVSMHRADQPEAERLVAGLGIDRVPNVDRRMAVPAGITKLTGTRALLDRGGSTRGRSRPSAMPRTISSCSRGPGSRGPRRTPCRGSGRR